jgi:hypothetical protein
LKARKTYLGYPSIPLLGQKVDSLGLTTVEDKLKAIAKLPFQKTLKDLETYLGMTGWLRDYVAQVGDRPSLWNTKLPIKLTPPHLCLAFQEMDICNGNVNNPTKSRKDSWKQHSNITQIAW